MTIADCAGLIREAEELVVVCGAGLSADVAPLAQAIEDGLWATVTRLAANGDPVDLHRARATGNEVREPYLTLELLVSGLRHRVPDLAEPLGHLYDELFRLKISPGRANRALARALAKARAKRIVVLTSNFDDGLTTAFETHDQPYRLVTDANVRDINSRSPDPARRIDVCAYHGTVDEKATDGPHSRPTSMAARDLAHPFAPDMATYIETALSTAGERGLVLFVGHRGEDYYDLNILVRLIADRCRKSDAPGWRSRFACIPHKGDLAAVSDFYRDTFTDEGLVVLTDGTGDDWLTRLCDAVSGETTDPGLEGGRRDARHVEERFREILAGKGLESDPVVARQCAALLTDIESGILAAWSVTEHYRLESLGYEQPEIAAFGRPGLSRRFHGVPVAELIGLQREYQDFRQRIDALQKRQQAGTELANGFALMRRLETFVEQALRAMMTAPAGTQRAMAALLAAIGTDYAGLVAMRCGRAQRTLPDPCVAMTDLDPARDASLRSLADSLARLDASAFAANQTQRADDLFAASVALAAWAGAELAIDARQHARQGEETGYAESLAQIVAWEDWTLAPEENRLRLPLAQGLDKADRARIARERIDGFDCLIRRRIGRINAALGKSGAERSFSAAGDAAQCSQRLNEVMRLVMGLGETSRGRPTGSPYAGDPAIAALVADVAARAVHCLKAGRESSSVKNFRFLAAYEARTLAALFAGDEAAAKAEVVAGEDYAKGKEGVQTWKSRLEDLRSRRPT